MPTAQHANRRSTQEANTEIYEAGKTVCKMIFFLRIMSFKESTQVKRFEVKKTRPLNSPEGTWRRQVCLIRGGDVIELLRRVKNARVGFLHICASLSDRKYRGPVDH